MKLKHNSHQVYELGYHLVWCTKFRKKVLTGDVELACKNVLHQTCGVYGWKMEELEIMPDHVHAFVSAPPQTSPAEIAKTLKSISALAIFTQFPDIKQRKFWGKAMWSPSTYFGTVGHISEDTVREYIQTQKQRA